MSGRMARRRGWGAGLFEAALLFSVFWLRSFFPGLGIGSVAKSDGILGPIGPADTAWHFGILLNLLPAGALILWTMQRREGLDAFELRPRPAPRDAAGSLAVLALLLGLGFLPQFLLGLFAGKTPLPSWLDNPLLDGMGHPRANASLFLPLLLASSLVTGYVEELYFRVYLSFRLGSAGLSKAARIILTSLIFGLSHGSSQGLAAALIACLLGAILALRWESTKSWHEIGLGHGLYDFVVLVAVLYS